MFFNVIEIIKIPNLKAGHSIKNIRRFSNSTALQSVHVCGLLVEFYRGLRSLRLSMFRSANECVVCCVWLSVASEKVCG